MMKIIKGPIGFLGNLVRAVGAGLQLFVRVLKVRCVIIGRL
ncbi:hypothetical protein [Streptomyces atratus]|nr:hypothetical protein [Streptomyces atratus]